MPALRNCLISSLTLFGANALVAAEASASRLTTLSVTLRRYLYKYTDKYDPNMEQRFYLFGKICLEFNLD